MFYFVRKLFYAYLLISGITICSVFAQSTYDAEKLLSLFDLYNKTKPNNQLFVHIDKTLYGNNETMWFSAYLIKSNNETLHKLLSVALIREDGQRVELSSKHFMNNGLSFGSIDLPDTLLAGNYIFAAYTNVMDNEGNPTAIFKQPITVKVNTENSLVANLELLDTTFDTGIVRAKVSLQLNNTDKSLTPSLEYTVTDGKTQTILMRNDDYTLNIRQEDVKSPLSILMIKVKYGKNTRYLSAKLPQVNKGIKVTFYPEGGSLSHGLVSVIGWEATLANRPVQVQGVLYKNNIALDTLATDAYGIGRFRLKSEPGYKYEFKLKSNAYQSRDTSYLLPLPLQNGIVLHLNQAIVDDTLRLNVYSVNPRNTRLLIHNYREIYAAVSIIATPTGSKATIALNALPKGIATVTVLDEMERPLAERLFFAKYHQKVIVKITTDKPAYNPKEKVTVNVKLTDQNGKTVDGLFSAAVVQRSRLEATKLQNIDDYAYLSYDLGNMPSPASDRLDNRENLENNLLIRGWRKYKWQELVTTTPADTATQVKEPKIGGVVTRGGKFLKKPVTIINLRNNEADLISTKSNGEFNLNLNDLLVQSGQKMTLSIGEKNKQGYLIEIQDPYKKINNDIARFIKPYSYGLVSNTQKNADKQLTGLQGNIILREVKITGTQSNTQFYNINPRGANPCGDYVTDDFLNRPDFYNNPRNKPPEQGKRYIVGYNVQPSGEFRRWGTPINDQVSWVWWWDVYAGCSINKNDNVFKVGGIYTAREFYGVKTDMESIIEPQFLSTLFWKPGILTNKTGDAEFTFYTGDITEAFKIIVQGLNSNEVFSGNQTFSVVKK